MQIITTITFKTMSSCDNYKNNRHKLTYREEFPTFLMYIPVTLTGAICIVW
jgi:hypothetical protein